MAEQQGVPEGFVEEPVGTAAPTFPPLEQPSASAASVPAGFTEEPVSFGTQPTFPSLDNSAPQQGPQELPAAIDWSRVGTTATLRTFLKNFSATPAQMKQELEQAGFEVGDQIGGGFNFLVRPGGSKQPFRPVDLGLARSLTNPEEFVQDMFDMTMDITGGILAEMAAITPTIVAFAGGGPVGSLGARVATEALVGTAFEGLRQAAGSIGGIENNIDPQEMIRVGLFSALFSGGAKGVQTILRARAAENALVGSAREVTATIAGIESPVGVTRGDALSEVAAHQRAGGVGPISRAVNRRTGRPKPKHNTINEYLDDFVNTVRIAKDGGSPEALAASKMVQERASEPVDMRRAIAAMLGLGDDFLTGTPKVPASLPKPDRQALNTTSAQIVGDFTDGLVDIGLINEPKIMAILDSQGRTPTTVADLNKLLDQLSTEDGIKAYVKGTFSPEDQVDLLMDEMPLSMGDTVRQRLQKESMFDSSRMTQPPLVRQRATEAQAIAREILGLVLDPPGPTPGKFTFTELRAISSQKQNVASDVEEAIGRAMSSEQVRDGVQRATEGLASGSLLDKAGKGNAANVLASVMGDFNISIQDTIKAYDATHGTQKFRELFRVNSIQSVESFRRGSSGAIVRGIPNSVRLSATGLLVGVAVATQVFKRVLPGVPTELVSSLALTGAALSSPKVALATTRTAQGALETAGNVARSGLVQGPLAGIAAKSGAKASPFGDRERLRSVFENERRKEEFDRGTADFRKRAKTLPGIN